MPCLLILLALLKTSLVPLASGTAPTQTKVLAASLPAVISAPQTPPVETPLAIAKIREAARDLQMQSETDAPLRVEFWPSDETEISPAQVALLAAIKTDNFVETKTVEQFFANSISVEDWMNDDEKAEAQRFHQLVEVLNANLENPRVYLFGERARQVVIIGKVKGGFGGLVTLVVET